MLRWIVLGILLFPVVEIAVFVLVAAQIGVAGAFLLLFATTLLGIFVLRQVGRGRLTGFRVAVGERNITAFEANSDGFLIILGGLLLALPGFITDLIGLLLLLGPIRRWCGAALQRAARGRKHDRDAVVDLDPDEYRRVPDRQLENPRNPRDRD